MKVFISYSVHDSEFVKEFAEALKPHVESLKFWEESKEPGEDAWKSIFSWIDGADLVLAVITDKTISRAMAVGNEIGHARAKNKKVIPLVAPDIDDSQLGCLKGVTYQRIDKDDPKPAIEAIAKEINRMKQVKQQAGQSDLGDLLVIAGLVALVIWAEKK